MPHDGAKSVALEDTNPRVKKIQLDLLRGMGPTRRLNLMRSMTAAMIRTNWDQIQREHPAWTENEVRTALVARLYGHELAERVRARLERERT